MITHAFARADPPDWNAFPAFSPSQIPTSSMLSLNTIFLLLFSPNLPNEEPYDLQTATVIHGSP